MSRHLTALSVLALCATAFAAPPATAPAPPAGTTPAATLVTLQLKDESAQSAFEQFGRAAHVQLKNQSPRLWQRVGDREITLDADRQPYWRVLSDLCAATGLLPLHSADGTVELMADSVGWGVRPTSIEGPFLVQAATVDSRRTIALGRTPRRTSWCALNLHLAAEPGLHASYIEESRFDAIEGGDGNPITRKPPPGPFKDVFRQGIAWVPIILDPQPGVHVIKRLDARFAVVVVSQTKTLEVPDIMKAQKLVREFGDLTFTFTTRPAEGGCDVAAGVHYKGNDAAQWQRIRNSLSVMTPGVLDAQGVEYARAGVGAGGPGPGDNEFRIQYRTPRGAPVNPGPPDKLSWDIPTAFQNVLVPLHFKDLPLP